MKKHFPLMQDCPEFPKRFVGLIYGVLAFFTLPFLMLVLVQGSFENEAVMNGVEIAYHVINGLLGLRLVPTKCLRKNGRKNSRFGILVRSYNEATMFR